MAEFDRRMNLRLTVDTFEALSEFAELEGKTVSSVVRDLLDQSAPYLRQLAFAFNQMQEAIARGAVAEAAQGVKLYQQVASAAKSGALSMEALGEVMGSELARAGARQSSTE